MDADIATGTEYGAENVFDLTKMEPYNLDKLYKSFTKISKEVVLYLPRTSDLNQIARYGQDGKKLEVTHYAMMGASKVCRCTNPSMQTITNNARHYVYILEISISSWGKKTHRVCKINSILSFRHSYPRLSQLFDSRYHLF